MKYTVIGILLTICLEENKALYQLTTFPDTAIEGNDLTLICSFKGRYVEFRKDDKRVCVITGSNPDNTCQILGSYNLSFIYTCDSSSYRITIPGIYLTENLHDTIWKCLSIINPTETSNFISLYIIVPITAVTISSTPEDGNPVKVIKENSKLFICRTNAGRPPARIQWYLSNVNITDYATNQPNICATDCSGGKMITSSQLTYTGNTIDSGKTVYCTASNIEGYSVMSMNKTIDVLVPITAVTISSTLEDGNPVKVIKESSKLFTCRTDAGKPPATIQWYLSNVNITNFATNQSHICVTDCSDGIIISSSQLIYKGNTNDNGKTLYCTASNIEGYSVMSMNKIIDVLVPITTVTISSTLEDENPVKVIKDNSKLFTCKTDAGRPPATIQWYISNVNITSFATNQYDECGTDCSDGKMISSSQLTYIGNTDDSGKIIYCTALNIEGYRVRSTNKTLDVLYSPSTPSITQTPRGPVNENTTIILTCEIKGGNPQANITWHYNGLTPVDSTGTIMNTSASVSHIQLIAKKMYNEFVFSCTGSHPAWTQSNSSSFILNILYAPTIPTINQMPIGPIIEGNMMILTCEISGGNPLATITWICDGFTHITASPSPFTDKVISSIERNVTKISDGQECICRGHHPLWTENREARQTLIVYFSPDISPTITQIPSGNVDEGTQINLTCEVQGGKPLAIIEWQCAGSSPIAFTTSQPTDKTISSVELPVTKYQNGEMCTCYGFHPAWNQNKSTSIRLDVNYPPESFRLITQTPSGPIVEDNRVILTCEIIGGNPLATLFWQCDGFTPITSPGILPTNKVMSSIQKIVTKEDNGNNCTCTGQHRLWTPNHMIRKHTLQVYYSSTIQIVNTMPIRLVENKTMVLICAEVDGIPRNASFVWYKSNTIIGAVANYSIRDAKSKDAGYYTCTGSNGFGRKSEAITEVFVLYSPIVSVSSVMNHNTIAEDNTAVLQCAVQSNPPPNIVWTKHESNTILHRISNVFQSNLTIDNANCLDTGNYTCKAMNIINNDKYTSMKDIELFVKCSPRRHNSDSDGVSQNPIVLAIGENLTISQHIIAFPIGISSWTFKRDENSPETTVYSTSNCSTYNVTNHHICFSRLNLTATNFGLYSVIIVNDVGKATFTYNVIPEGPPEPPINILVACEITSMIVSWRPGFDGGSQQSFRVIWLNIKTLKTEYSSEIMELNQDSTKQYIVKSLTSDTSYIIYVEATNKHGIVRSSDNDNCTTGSSLLSSQSNNSLVTSVAAAIGTSVFILLVASLVLFILKRRWMNIKKEDSKLYQSTQPGTSRQRTNTGENDYSELQTKKIYCNTDGKEVDSANTYEEIGRINDGQIYQNVCKNKKEQMEMDNVSTIYANMVI